MAASFDRDASCAMSSHTPGPVERTVFMPLRKSGMPQLQEEKKNYFIILRDNYRPLQITIMYMYMYVSVSIIIIIIIIL